MGPVKVDRVVVINDSIVARGGATALAVLSAQLLRERGIPVTYVTGDQGDVDHSLGLAGIEILALGGKNLLKSSALKALTSGLFNFKAIALLKNWIELNDTAGTVYHLHGWQQILSPAIFLGLKAVSNRTLMHAHDYFLVCPNGGQMNYVTNAPCNLRPLSLSCISTNCDKRNFAHKIWRVGRHKVRNIFEDLSGADVKIAMIKAEMNEAFTRYGIDKKNLITIENPSVPFSKERVCAEKNKEFQFVGRLVAEKGIKEFLLAAQAAEVSVRVMGDGPLLEELRARHSDVIFEGWCTREQMADLVQGARMLVMPSIYPEPYGLVIPEAISSGIPVIVSGSALLASDVVRNEVGLLVDPLKINEFALLLKKCASDDELIESMSKKGAHPENGISKDQNQWITDILIAYSNLVGVKENAVK